MEWLNDSYTLIAGDVSQVWCGRGFNLGDGNWESLMGTKMTPTSLRTRSPLIRAVDLRVMDGVTGGIKDGVFVMVFVVANGTHTEFVMPILQGMASRSKLLCKTWEIGVPMLGGIQWRIMQGGLAACDRVDMGVAYE